MFIIADTTAAELGTDARELVHAVDIFVLNHYGSLLPKDRTSLLGAWSGVEVDEIGADDFFDHFLEFSTLFPQLPGDDIKKLAACTLRASNLPMMRTWGSAETAEKIQSSIVAPLREVVDTHELSEVQREILKAITNDIAGDAGSDGVSLSA